MIPGDGNIETAKSAGSRIGLVPRQREEFGPDEGDQGTERNFN